MTCAENLRAKERREQCYDLRRKQVIRATVLSKQCTVTSKVTNDVIRHKSKLTLAYSVQQHPPAIPCSVRYDGFVLTRFTVRPDGRTLFQYLLGAPYVSTLCVFGESVVAMISDHEVRAAKLTNRWISGCWWRRDASSDEHLVGTKFGLLKCRSFRRKPPGEQWSRRETLDARGTKWKFDVDMDAGRIPAPLEVRRHEESPTAPAPVPPPQPESQESVLRGQGVHAKALRVRAYWSEHGRTPGCLACETLGRGKSHTRERKTFQDVWEESRRTATAKKVKRGIVVVPDT